MLFLMVCLLVGPHSDPQPIFGRARGGHLLGFAYGALLWCMSTRMEGEPKNKKARKVVARFWTKSLSV